MQAKGKNQSIAIYECFDADSDEQIELKKSTLPHFDAGIAAYYSKDMMAARQYFDNVYQVNRSDLTAFSFLNKIHGFIMNGVPENWSGVEIMQNK